MPTRLITKTALGVSHFVCQKPLEHYMRICPSINNDTARQVLFLDRVNEQKLIILSLLAGCFGSESVLISTDGFDVLSQEPEEAVEAVLSALCECPMPHVVCIVGSDSDKCGATRRTKEECLDRQRPFIVTSVSCADADATTEVGINECVDALLARECDPFTDAELEAIGVAADKGDPTSELGGWLRVCDALRTNTCGATMRL